MNNYENYFETQVILYQILSEVIEITDKSDNSHELVNEAVRNDLCENKDSKTITFRKVSKAIG